MNVPRTGTVTRKATYEIRSATMCFDNVEWKDEFVTEAVFSATATDAPTGEHRWWVGTFVDDDEVIADEDNALDDVEWWGFIVINAQTISAQIDGM